MINASGVGGPSARSLAPSVLEGGDLADLARLYEPDVMVVSGPIPPSPAALQFAETLAASEARHTSVKVNVDGGVPDAGALEDLANGLQEGAADWITYVTEVTALFAELLDARQVGVRQIVSDGPHCSRFHVDRVPARGVLNVLGACTEWLPDSDVDRSRLGHAGGDDDSTSGLVRDWTRLQRARHGALTMFKGTAWPGAEERAVVHRSPPSDGGRRLLLTLDWIM